MKKILAYLIVNGIALYLVTSILSPDFMITGGVKGYLITAFILGIVNTLVKPILKLLSLPLMILTLGLFSIVINMLMLGLGKYLINVFAFEGVAMEVAGTLTYLWAAILLSIFNMILHGVLRK